MNKKQKWARRDDTKQKEEKRKKASVFGAILQE